MCYLKYTIKELLLCIALILCLIFMGCSNVNKGIVHDKFENTENNVDSLIQYDDGNAIEFIDSEIKKCICNYLNISEDSAVTDKMCKDVKELDLKGYTPNTLTDLSNLPNLETLYVDNQDNKLDLKGINKAPNLKKVTLRNCRLSEVDRLADLNQLEYLDISTDSVWGTSVNDYSTLSKLTNLKYLDMGWRGYNAYNPFSTKDGSFINGLTNIEELNIYETGIENYSLDNLSNLKRLTISETSVDWVLESLSKSGALKNIEYLYTGSQGDQISNNGLQYLSNAANLKELHIMAGSLTTLEGLGNLKNLEVLYLYNNFDLPLSAYKEIGKLTSLTALKIDGNCPNGVFSGNDNVNPYGYEFLNTLTNLKILSIIPYDGMAIKCFKDLKSLEYLILSGTAPFEREVDIESIDEFTALTNFNYSDVRLKSTAPLDDLDYLNAHDMHITETDKFDSLYFNISDKE